MVRHDSPRHGVENAPAFAEICVDVRNFAAGPHDGLSLRIQFRQHPRPNGLRLLANPLRVGDPTASPVERLVVVKQTAPLVVPLALHSRRWAKTGMWPRTPNPPKRQHILVPIPRTRRWSTIRSVGGR